MIAILHGIELCVNKPFLENIKFVLGIFNEGIIGFLVIVLFYMKTVEEAKQDLRLVLGKFLIFALLLQRIGNALGLLMISFNYCYL